MEFNKNYKSRTIAKTVLIPPDDIEHLEIIAQREQCTISEVIRQLIKSGLAQYEKEKGHDER